MPILGPAGRRGRRRGLIVGAAVGSHAAKKNAAKSDSQGAAAGSDQYDELEKLAKLHADGVLTDEEFAAQKAKLLG